MQPDTTVTVSACDTAHTRISLAHLLCAPQHLSAAAAAVCLGSHSQTPACNVSCHNKQTQNRDRAMTTTQVHCVSQTSLKRHAQQVPHTHRHPFPPHTQHQAWSTNLVATPHSHSTYLHRHLAHVTAALALIARPQLGLFGGKTCNTKQKTAQWVTRTACCAVTSSRHALGLQPTAVIHLNKAPGHSLHS